MDRRPQPTWSALPALFAGLLSGCGAVERTSADRFTRDGRLIALSGGDAGGANACFTCHGLYGRGNGAGAPRLAGLDVGYLNRQMESYASGTRRHPQMEWIARRLSPSQRQEVSAYYAAMRYEPTPAAAPLPPAPAIYVAGDPKRGLIPCAACHGLAGQGVGPANPPLGGQPAAYLAEQMEKWRLSERRNDPGNIMLRISRRLTPREIAAVSAYAATLPGGPPSPESPAASPAARRDGSRNDASAPPPRGAEQGPSASR